MKPLQELTRPNIWALKPYSSARDEYSGAEASIFLDANENPYNTPNNRYPDPLQDGASRDRHEFHVIVRERKIDQPEARITSLIGRRLDDAVDGRLVVAAREHLHPVACVDDLEESTS